MHDLQSQRTFEDEDFIEERGFTSEEPVWSSRRRNNRRRHKKVENDEVTTESIQSSNNRKVKIEIVLNLERNEIVALPSTFY